jgi:hypothetical protein
VVEAVAMIRAGAAATRVDRHGEARSRRVVEAIPAAEHPAVRLEEPRDGA